MRVISGTISLWNGSIISWIWTSDESIGAAYPNAWGRVGASAETKPNMEPRLYAWHINERSQSAHSEYHRRLQPTSSCYGRWLFQFGNERLQGVLKDYLPNTAFLLCYGLIMARNPFLEPIPTSVRNIKSRSGTSNQESLCITAL